MKLVLVLTAVIASTQVARAQVASVGAYGGVNRESSHSSPIGGMRFGLGLGGSFALGVAVEYSGRGVSLVRDGMSTVDYSAGYLAAPIAMRFQLGQGRAPVHLSVGTTFGALLFATQTQDGVESDVRGDLEPIAITADLGAGIAIRLTPRITLDLDGRWSIALVEGVKRDAALDADAWQERSLQITAGLTFTLNPAAPPAGPTLPAMPAM